MSYTSPEWTSGDVGGDETKLDNMQGDLDYLRDQLNYRTVASSAGRSEGGSGIFPGILSTTDCRISCQGSFAPAASSIFDSDGTVRNRIVTQDISSIQVGEVARVEIWLEAYTGSVWLLVSLLGVVYVARSADEDFLRVNVSVAAYANRKWYEPVPASVSTNYVHCALFSTHVGLYRSGSGDTRWLDAEFVAASPVSSTLMNRVATNATVVRERIDVAFLGGSCAHALGDAANHGGSLETAWAFRLQFFFDGTLVGNAVSSFPPTVGWPTYSAINIPMPSPGTWGHARAEVRFQIANASSPTLWVGSQGLDTNGWIISETHFWRDRDMRFVHFFVSAQGWRDRTIWMTPSSSDFTVKTAGIGYLASAIPISVSAGL